MPGTIAQREQAKAEIKQRNQKDIFELPPELLVAGQPVHIFNVSPLRWQKSMGSYGQWTIHPCDEGKTHSLPTVVPYITNDPVHIDMNQMAHRHDSGRKLALDILGVGQFHTPGENLTMWGCFVAEDLEPTDKELRKANKALDRMWDLLIAEGDSFWNQGPASYINVQELHRMAARKRNQTNKPWCREIEIPILSKCNICQTAIDPKAALCTACGNVLNEQMVIAARLPKYEHLWNKSAK